MYIVLILIIISLLYLLLKPVFARKLDRVELVDFQNLNDIRKELSSVAITMLNSDRSYMSFNDENNLYTDLAKLKEFLKGDKRHKNYSFYNFPKAFLMIGILDHYASYSYSYKEVEDVILQKYINSDGSLRFKFDKIDQSLFGVVFIKIYNLTGNQIYKTAADQVYKSIQEFKNTEGFYLYRKSDHILFIDTLGMVVPFLAEYSKLYKDNNIQKEAELQVYQYIENTVCDQKDFPPHAFDLESNLKLGSNNWSRGIAWLMLGLAYVSKENQSYHDIFDFYFKKLCDLRTEKYWPQFFSHSNDDSIDASATIMIYYAASLAGKEVRLDLNQALKDSISKKYFIENNSGDTIYINKYSKTKGKSEVSQGLLLSILAT